MNYKFAFKRGKMNRRRLYIVAGCIFSVLATIGVASNWFIRTVDVQGSTTIFYSSPSMTFTLASLSILYLIVFIIILANVFHKQKVCTSGAHITNKRFFVRFMLCLFILCLFLLTTLATVYFSTRKIIIDNEKIEYRTILTSKSVRWLEVKRLKGNFYRGLGFGNDYGWVDFETQSGRVIRIPVTFIINKKQTRGNNTAKA